MLGRSFGVFCEEEAALYLCVCALQPSHCFSQPKQRQELDKGTHRLRKTDYITSLFSHQHWPQFIHV